MKWIAHLFGAAVMAFTVNSVLAGQTMTASDAYNQAAAAGSTGIATGQANSTSAQATASLSGYSATSANSSYFGGGLGDTITPGSAKKAGCVTSTSTDPMIAQECNATNYLSNLDSYKPALSLTKSDPLITKGRAVENDPGAIADNLAATYTACQTTSTVTPGVTTHEVCDDFFTDSAITCPVNRVVKVAVDRNYQCIDTKNTLSAQNCNKTLAVSVAWFNSCTPGTYFGSYPIVTHGNGEAWRYAGIYVNAFCNPDATTIGLYFYTVATENYSQTSINFTVNASTGNTSPQTWAISPVRSWYSTDYQNSVTYNGGSCSGNTCSFTFTTHDIESYPLYDIDGNIIGFGTSDTVRANGTFTFTKPHSYHVDTDTWTNGCAALEAKAL